MRQSSLVACVACVARHSHVREGFGRCALKNASVGENWKEGTPVDGLRTVVYLLKNGSRPRPKNECREPRNKWRPRRKDIVGPTGCVHMAWTMRHGIGCLILRAGPVAVVEH